MINTLQPISNHHCHFWQVNPTSSSCNSNKFAPLRWPQHQLSMFTEMADFFGCEIEVQEVHYVHMYVTVYIYIHNYTYTRVFICINMYIVLCTPPPSSRPPAAFLEQTLHSGNVDWFIAWGIGCASVHLQMTSHCLKTKTHTNLGQNGYGSKLGTPKLWMVNTKLD